jgi:hypothetical protein
MELYVKFKDTILNKLEEKMEEREYIFPEIKKIESAEEIEGIEPDSEGSTEFTSLNTKMDTILTILEKIEGKLNL